jgi:hypothetical protein
MRSKSKHSRKGGLSNKTLLAVGVLRVDFQSDQGTSFEARSRFTCCLTSLVRSIAAFAQSCSLAGRGVNVG